MKVATVFSGIGAIEHALERMGIEHEIVFACDNSNLEVFSSPSVDKSADVLTVQRKLQNVQKRIFQLLQKLEEILNLDDDRLAFCCNEGCRCLDYQSMEISHIIPSAEQMSADYSKFTVVKLKEELRERGLPVSGKKANLVFRLVDDNLESLHVGKNQLALNDWTNLRLLCPNHAELIDENEVKYRYNSIKEMICKTIHSIKDPFKRKKAVDALYNSSKKKAFVEQSYLANYDVPINHFHKDISFLQGEPHRGNVDLFVGGSPCQSFSFVGHQGGFNDARGTLFYDFVRLVDEIKPKMFIWENVKGVYTHDEGETWDVITKCFDNTGYTWSHAILNSKDYGIPQNRQRVFVVGFIENDTEYSFPEPIDLKLTMQDFLEDQVAGKYYLNTKGVDFVTLDKNHRKQYTQINGDVMLCQKANQQFNWHGDFVFVEGNQGQHLIDERHFLSQKVEAYVMATGTKGFRSIPEIDLEVARPLLSSMHKNHRAGIDNYITTEGRIRMLTPKECLRLMGFCDSFKQVVSNNQLYRQAGNSIVVDVLIAILAQAIPILAGQDKTFSSLQKRVERIKELFDELPERQIQQSDLERVVAALLD